MNEFLIKILDKLHPQDVIEYVIILALVLLLWNKDRMIKNLTENLAANTELLRVLVYGREKARSEDEEAN
jgi:hypothetical protein